MLRAFLQSKKEVQGSIHLCDVLDLGSGQETNSSALFFASLALFTFNLPTLKQSLVREKSKTKRVKQNKIN